MIEQRKGNLLETDAEALVNTVNCVGIMGKGIALQFKQAFPANFEAYAKACRLGLVKLGEVFVFDTGSMVQPRWIINFPTKQDWRSRSRLADIRSGMESLVRVVSELGIKSVAIPPLGCGNGGLDWKDVEPVIRASLNKLPDVRVYLFPPQDPPRADEMRVGTKRPNLTRARALLIKLLGQYQQFGYRHSLLEVQKLAYFLQEAGEPMKLKYVQYYYGPYAENLNHVLQRIEGHYTRGYGDRRATSQIYLMPDAEKEADKILADSVEARERLARVKELISGFETPYGMELLSSVYWAALKNPDIADDPRRVVRSVQSWSDRKRQVLKVSHIIKAWQRLRAADWIPGSRLGGESR